METSKQEVSLSLALAETEQERAHSLDLNVGYHAEEKNWELIVKYTGSLEAVAQLDPRIRATGLRHGFGILLVPEELVEAVVARPEILYAEKPKRLYFAAAAGRAASCVGAMQSGPEGLTGKGVLVGIVDSGIDLTLPDFRKPEGGTRVVYLWDQTTPFREGNRYGQGRVYSEEEINQALQSDDKGQLGPMFGADTGGHGTAVAGILAGNGRGAGEEAESYRGIAYEAELLVVKLGTPRPHSFPRTTQLMMAVDALVTEALRRNRPLVLNLSFGNSYGPHDGSALLDQYLDRLAEDGRFLFVTGSGNEGAARGHASVRLREGVPAEVSLVVGAYEPTLNLQIWKSYPDEWTLELEAPSGQRMSISPQMQPGRALLDETWVLVYYGQPSPFSMTQEIYLDWFSEKGPIAGGVWRLHLRPVRIREGRVDFWLPGGGVLSADTGFLRPDPETTLTIPGTAVRLVTVAAYDSARGAYADFSGRGFLRLGGQIKPDLAAPGVDVLTTAVGGGYVRVSGTSFAAPFVSGVAALMMEWGIVKGNDPLLYGERLKACLLRGTKTLPGTEATVNPKIGWGALCGADGFPWR